MGHLGSICPSAFPFEGAPRIPQADEFRLAEQPASPQPRDESELAGIENGVRVAGDEATLVVDSLAVEALAVAADVLERV